MQARAALQGASRPTASNAPTLEVLFGELQTSTTFQITSDRTLPGGALVVWPETLSRTPWLINKSAGGPPFFFRASVVFPVCIGLY